ncbi:hypothetical protein ACLI4U_09675 [Natrialbaceae archaeon A-CW2]
MDYNHKESKIITELFNHFFREGVSFVVPRGHENLPNSVPGGDIDIIVRVDDFEQAIHLSEKLGFGPKKGPLSRVTSLAGTGLRNPVSTISYIISKPGMAISKITDSATGPNPTSRASRKYSEWKGWNGEVMIHFMNHLAYESPMNGRMIRVDQEVEDSLFSNSQKSNGVSIPSEVDELCHLLCRGIFSKNGEFPEYYISRCNYLRNNMLSSEEERFDQHLSMLFFNADTLVKQRVKEGKYNTLRDDLNTFSDY